MNLDTITTPTLLLDPDRCRQNLSRLLGKTNAQRISLRPHFKTHQSRLIGEWFREEGIHAITVSSAGMARYFADAGWKDITIAFPCNVRQLAELQGLSRQIRLGLLVLDTGTVDLLGKSLGGEAHLWIKIDVGTHRTGLDPNLTGQLDQVIEKIKTYPSLHFAGFLAHAGHSYHSYSVTEVQRIHDNALGMMLELKQRYLAEFPGIKISLGDTPGASMIEQFGPVDELRPGNFIFYDLMQQEIGACTTEDIAVAMACPVVAVHPERLQWIIYGGAIHFSKDYFRLTDGKKCFGRMTDWIGTTWSTDMTPENPYLVSLSQEHGVVQCREENFQLCRPGDLALFLPVHSCLTADAMGAYLSVKGDSIDHYRQHMRA